MLLVLLVVVGVKVEGGGGGAGGVGECTLNVLLLETFDVACEQAFCFLGAKSSLPFS